MEPYFDFLIEDCGEYKIYGSVHEIPFIEDDIDFDIELRYVDNNRISCKTIMPDKFPLYRDSNIIEMAIDALHRFYYENKKL